MTLREKILKTFIVTIREINTHGGPEEFFEKYPVGGMYYSEGNILLGKDGLEMGTATTHEKLERCKKASKQKLLICADPARRFESGQISLGAGVTDEMAYNLGKAIGMGYNAKGVDWILGPSIDMCKSSLFPLLAISDDEKYIARVYRQVVRGMQEQGICATVKHFPGLGTNHINMHFAPGANVLSFEEWMETYGYAYKQMFEENVMSVMTTHTTLKSYTDEKENGYYPIATFSKKLTTDLLKGELGFKGAVVTDALIMGGMATGDLVAETVQAFTCGADLLLWPPVEAAEKIEELINSGEIPMSRLDDALARIERMESFRNEAVASGKYDEPDEEFISRTLKQLTGNGICLRRNDMGVIPLDTEKYKNILIIDTTDETDYGSSKMLRDELVKRGISADVLRDIYDVPSRVCWQNETDELAEKYDLVIFNINANIVASWSEPFMLIWNSHLFTKQKKVIVNYGSPYFAVEYFPEDPTIIEMNCVPSADSVELLADRLLGEAEFTGENVLRKQK